MKAIFAGAIPLLLALSTSASPTNSTLHKRAQCQAWLDLANGVSTRLNSNYFNSGTGNYNGGNHWTDANIIENIHNLMLATGGNQWANVADQSYLGRAVAQQKATGVSPWAGIVEGSWDDSQWMIMALWKVADYKRARGLDASAYYTSAQSLYNLVQGAWDNTCGGGLWWSGASDYKNCEVYAMLSLVITYLSRSNHQRTVVYCHLLVSATGAILFPNQSQFLTNAINVRNWIKNSALRNSQGLFNDGLVTSTCANNGQTTWIYNQGVIAAGLGTLYATTKDASLLTDAEITLDAAIKLLTSGGILKESCDNPTTRGCNNDQIAFKGIFMRSLQYYLDRVNDPARVAKYSGFIHAQASGVYHYGTSGSNDIGSVWWAPNAGGSVFESASSGSGLAAHIINAKYGPCGVAL
ncbi:Six-hairpin glycosidase [Mycena indigotica]|uniref:Six-hairpin glycosidase n=1 Tax=Mycena indigotica TaxID=2126181 RepID=A0A8H6TBJ8_9AGAR|nr:Six-hairpin glycosidase [Mycena indigotica]KAF7315755.1 Six-hairpin glycosidase [Mycena indigotica]